MRNRNWTQKHLCSAHIIIRACGVLRRPLARVNRVLQQKGEARGNSVINSFFYRNFQKKTSRNDVSVLKGEPKRVFNEVQKCKQHLRDVRLTAFWLLVWKRQSFSTPISTRVLLWLLLCYLVWTNNGSCTILKCKHVGTRHTIQDYHDNCFQELVSFH